MRLHEDLVAESASTACLASNPATRGILCSGKGGVESLEHRHDVLAIAWRPDGKRLASSTLGGQIYIWNPHENELLVGNLLDAVLHLLKHSTEHLMPKGDIMTPSCCLFAPHACPLGVLEFSFRSS